MCIHYRCIVSSNVFLVMCRIAGINGRVIGDTLESVAQALHGLHNQVGDEFHGLGNSQRNNPLNFKGKYDPKVAHVWRKEIENIF